MIFEFLVGLTGGVQMAFFFRRFLAVFKGTLPFAEIITLKSRRDRDRPSGDVAGFLINYVTNN